MNNLGPPVQIIVGSMLGATEYVAESLQEVLKQNQIESQIHFQPDFKSITKQCTWFICCSTHGAGDLPDNIQQFSKDLINAESSGDLCKTQFIVIALGDSSYDTFCQAGKTLFQQMLVAQSKAIADIFCIDVLEHTIPEETACEWLNQLLTNGSFPNNKAPTNESSLATSELQLKDKPLANS